MAAGARGDPFVRVAKPALVLTIFVILFGAVVRITGSGAGCGQHWPTCNGEVAHLPRRLETLIELTHRVTSGLALLAVVGLVVVAVREHPREHRARKLAYVALTLMVVEALIGAVLVLFALVEKNASVGRVVVMPVHLVSTYALTATLALSARPFDPRVPFEASTPPRWVLGWLSLGAAVIVVVSATGAVTALGDTLYPPSAATLAGRLAEDQGATATFLQRLRVVHPVLAVLGGAFVAWLGANLAAERGPRAHRASRTLTLVVSLQLAAGTLNVLLGAPGPMQVVHLALALGTWLAFVALAAELAWPAPP